MRRGEPMYEFVGASAAQPVALPGENFSEGQQLASGWALKQLSCRLRPAADQLRGADQLVFGGGITLPKGSRQAVSFSNYVGSSRDENRRCGSLGGLSCIGHGIGQHGELSEREGIHNLPERLRDLEPGACSRTVHAQRQAVREH